MMNIDKMSEMKFAKRNTEEKKNNQLSDNNKTRTKTKVEEPNKTLL